jgi:hypothetical protein
MDNTRERYLGITRTPAPSIPTTISDRNPNEKDVMELTIMCRTILALIKSITHQTNPGAESCKEL